MSVPPAFQPMITGPASNLPRSSTWVSSFDDLFNKNQQSMLTNGDNQTDIDMLHQSILNASSVGVDPRIILCIIMQESHGNVGVNGGGGLMQASESPSFPNEHYPNISSVQIDEMTFAGTQHFRGNLTNDAGLPLGQFDDDKIYEALRYYNSGSANLGDLSSTWFNNGNHGIPSYVSDIVYRLQGYTN